MTTVPAFRARKGKGEPLVVLTAYDAATAAAAEAGGVDALLVGDSLGMVVLGHDTTLEVTMDDMVHHARAVARRRRQALLIADMPWLSYHLGPDDAVVYPEHLTEELDYELELAVVISKPGKWFSPEEAMDYVGGYVIFNDITARDIQRREMRSGVFSFCKAIDTFCPLGPWIVTPDEVPDPHDLAMELRVNGEPRQVSHTGRMSVTIPQILSHYSALGYSAGDVLSTGTVSGVAGFSPDAASLYLRPGDVVEAEIERLGVLRNPVISWQEAHGEPPPERVRW